MKSIREKISTIVNDCIADIKRNSRAAGQVATGRTLRALEAEVTSFGDAYTARIVGMSYTGALETGRGAARRAGSPAEQRQFVQNLAEWCRIRGIHTEFNDKQLESFARYLKWRINKYGTELYRKGGRKDIITPAIDKMIDRIEVEIAQAIEGEITSINNKFFKRQKETETQ